MFRPVRLYWLPTFLLLCCCLGCGRAQPLAKLHTYCGKATRYCQPLTEFRRRHPGLLPVDPGIVELRGDTIYWTPPTEQSLAAGGLSVYLETADRHYHYRHYPPGQFAGQVPAPHTGNYLLQLSGPRPLFLVVERRRTGLSIICYGLPDL